MSRLLSRLTPYEGLKDWLRGLGVALAVGLFLTIVGAFDTDEAPPGRRFGFWMLLMVTGYVWGAFVARFFFAPGLTRRATPFRDAVLAATIMATPFTLVVWAAVRGVLGSPAPISVLPYLFFSVWVVSLVITGLNILIENRRAEPEPAAPKFLERLPLKLRGAEVWAVEAEDHYLRLHTSRGQDLILMRLADAVAELEGIEGAQVHRSWWVARDAITAARRGDGRATLTLKDGAEVPVSRTYAAMLRERKWI